MSLSRACILVIAAAWLASPSSAVAQQLQPGARIKVSAPQIPLVDQRGVLLFLDRDSLVLQSSGWDLGAPDAGPTRWSVPRTLVDQLEVSRGSRARRGTGLLIGAGVGLVVGLVSISPEGRCTGNGPYGLVCAVIVSGSVLGGGLLGVGIGSMVRSEEWERVSLQ